MTKSSVSRAPPICLPKSSSSVHRSRAAQCRWLRPRKWWPGFAGRRGVVTWRRPSR